jgi:hypothetical protein
MSYATILAGLHARFQTVAALKVILDYAPTAVHNTPCLFSELVNFTRGGDGGRLPSSGQLVKMQYRIAHRVLVRMQDNDQAEQEIIPLVNSICAAIDADPTLGGVLSGNGNQYHGGTVHISDGEGGYLRVGGAEYRVFTFYTNVYEKFAYKAVGL